MASGGSFDDEIDDVPYRAPLPPDDRIWRHPSELGAVGARSPRIGRLVSSLLARRRP